MPSDPTDLDALDYINRLAKAAGRNVHELLAEIAKTAEAALRARLAPPSAQQVTQEAWRALSMIREVVEQMGVGLMPAGEHTLPPTLAREAEVIVAALARLAAPAPTTHADDEVLTSGLRELADAYIGGNIAKLTTQAIARIAELRARIEGLCAALKNERTDNAEQRARAEAAERELAECRAKIARITTEPYHTVHRDFIKPEYFTPGHALKTKEPRT